MTDQEIIYKAIREVVNTDKPAEFAAHNSTCYTIAKYVCEELRKELNTLPAEQPISDYLQTREKISSYLYNLIFDQAHRGAPMLQHGDRRINEEVDLILKMAIRELDKKVPAEQPSEDVEEAANIFANKQGLELKPFARRFFIAGAQWQKEQMFKSAVSIGYLQDWYQNSIDGEVPPIWTDEHLNELTKDFYLIPKQKEDEQ